MSRRIFLRGVGGACLAAPFLSSLGDRTVKARSATPPRRLIVMFTHYGCITTRFFPKKSHGPLTAADLETTTLEHLVPFVRKMLMPRGIRAMNEWTPGMLRGQGNDMHLQVVGSYFTCQPVTPNSNDPFSFDSATKFNAKPVGPSLDHVIAKQLSPEGTPLLLNVGKNVDGPQSAISYSAAETVYSPAARSPWNLFTQITGRASSSDAAYRDVRRQSILDVVQDDLATLRRIDMSDSDRKKLEAWQALVRETEVASQRCSSEDLTMRLELTTQNLDRAASAPAEGEDAVTGKIDDTMDRADLFSRLAVLAAVCNANPVIVLKYPPVFLYRGLGITTESASLAHRLDHAGLSGTCYPRAIELLHRIDDFYARKFAYLLAQLDQFDEGEGTVLDNGAAVWFQENSDGLAHNLNNLPIVQVGSAGGYFKTGWAVNVEDGSPDLTTGNSEFFCPNGEAGEVSALDQETGTDPTLANAPINKYYCNLMNALGVRAGPDGFPRLGGDREVTHFGMYDRTEDFIGGGTNPPRITDPGEFTALRANT